jgi:hypothetical protein
LTSHHVLLHCVCMTLSTGSDEAPTAEPQAGYDYEVILAKMLALAARNGVEDLHSGDAFSDRQAPALNRRIRGRIYELLIAMHRRDYDRDDDRFGKYIDNLARGHRGGQMTAALQGAVGQAVDDFAAVEAIDPTTAMKLRKVAIKSAVEAYKTVTRLSLGRTKDEERDHFAVEWWLRSVPKYWEEPEVSPEFQKLLDASGRDGLAS